MFSDIFADGDEWNGVIGYSSLLATVPNSYICIASFMKNIHQNHFTQE